MGGELSICIFIRGFHNGGIEKVFENYFSHMDRSRFDLHIVTHMDNDLSRQQLFQNMGFQVHQMSLVHGHKIRWKNIREYWVLFHDYHFDIIHNNMPENLIPLFIGRICGVRHRILHAHNNYMDSTKHINRFKKLLYKMGFRFNTSMATKLIGCSLDAAIAAFGISASKNERITILYNAINIVPFLFSPVSRMDIRKILECENSTILVGHVGRYENNQKNQEFVLEIFKIFHKKNPMSKLVMVGEGKNRYYYHQMAVDMEISDAVIFTGAVSNVNEYYSAMDIFLFPSRHEGLGIVAVEAQASGIPVLMSDKVPEEAKVTGNTQSLSLQVSAEGWADRMESILLHTLSRQIDMSDFKKYDIKYEAQRLNDIYCSIKEGGK